MELDVVSGYKIEKGVSLRLVAIAPGVDGFEHGDGARID